jgi:20S proteasome alpha/beta subunit
MTICMGAVCQDEATSAVVVASDRMVTWASLTEFEHRVPKVRSIGATAVALIAGDALTGTRMAEEVASEKAGQALSVEQFADALSDRYVAIRMECVEADLLKARGLSLQTFYQMHQQLVPQITGGIDQEMAQYNLGVELLVAGVDGSGGHVFTIHNPGGRHLRHDVIGHAAIGSGWIHAIQSMIGFRHAAMQQLDETIFRVYVSKRRAELAPGVGRETDLMVITPSGPERLTEEAIAQLSELYGELESSAGKVLEGKIQSLKLDREEAFA